MSKRERANLTVWITLDKLKGEIEELARILSQTPDGHPNIPHLLARLGSSYSERFDLMGEPGDIKKGIEYTTFRLVLAPEDSPGLPGLLVNLGALHGKQFQCLRKVEDSDKAIEHMSLALALIPDGHPDLSLILTNLGSFHDNRFQHLGEFDDLQMGIEYNSRAVESTPDGHPHAFIRLSNLGGSLYNRFMHLGELGNLEKAIEYQACALRLTPDSPLQLLSKLSNLGESYTHWFRRLGELGDLEKAIEYESRALAIIPDGHPLFPHLLTNVGVCYRDWFRRLGELDDLEKATEYQSRLLGLTPDGDPRLPRRRLGELDDLVKAIKHISRALALTPVGHSDLPTLHVNLGASHNYRFVRLGEPGDLDKSIEHCSWAVSLTPAGHPSLSNRLANLGGSHRDRFQLLGELADLDKAIKHQSRAISLTPDGHPDLSRQLAILGVSLRNRYERLGEQVDLEKAIECMTCGLALTPECHPSWPDQHFPLAVCRFYQAQITGDSSQLQLSLDSFRIASQSLNGSPRQKFENAVRWAQIASVATSSSLNGIEAYQTAIDLLPQVIWLGATINQHYRDLSSIETLAVDAAFAAISSLDYALALEWLEHARCVVWNQILMLRSPLDQLHSSYPDLATRLRDIASQLHSASSESREFRALSGSMGVEQAARAHRRLAKEYYDLLTRARSLPDFGDFLRIHKVTDCVHTARNGPIVVINCHKDCCDALLKLPELDNITHIPLPNYTMENAQCAYLELSKFLRNKGIRERGFKVRQEPGKKDHFATVLVELWNNVVKPILDSLEYTSNTSADNLPHITWCPTGPLSFLPLHAAGDYDKPRSRVFDYAISSYTPTVTALLAATPSYLDPDSRLLVVGLQSTPGHSPLPGTAREITFVKGHAANVVEYSQLVNGQATTTTVLDAMEQHDWVHLACHAHQNVSDPTKSGFFMHDGTLDLASINRRSFKNKGLAFLSACQTATGDERLPDEAVHLASGMLMAGYSSVIATMWSVVDQDAPLVADRVYGQLMKDRRIGNGEAGKALHYAVAELRKQVGEKEFERWVPYIHIGS